MVALFLLSYISEISNSHTRDTSRHSLFDGAQCECHTLLFTTHRNESYVFENKLLQRLGKSYLLWIYRLPPGAVVGLANLSTF